MSLHRSDWARRVYRSQLTPASLTPMGKELTAKTRPKVEEGEILTFASRWCQPLGTPFIMGDSETQGGHAQPVSSARAILVTLPQ
jgi:hypothetical protein